MSIRRSPKPVIEADDFDSPDEFDSSVENSDEPVFDDAADLDVDLIDDPGDDGGDDEPEGREHRLELVSDAPADEPTDELADSAIAESDVTDPEVFDDLPPRRQPAVEAGLRHILSRRDLEGLPGRIAVVGPRSGVGVSTVANSLAWVLRGDFDALVCHVDLASDAPVGDGSLLAAMGDQEAIRQAVAELGDQEVVSLRLGEVTDDDWFGLVRSDEFAKTLRLLDSEFDFLVVELPPVLDGSRSIAALRHTEGVLTVVQHGSTRLADLDALQEELHGRDQIGAVLNRYRSRVPRRLGRRLGI